MPEWHLALKHKLGPAPFSSPRSKSANGMNMRLDYCVLGEAAERGSVGGAAAPRLGASARGPRLGFSARGFVARGGGSARRPPP